MNQLLSVDARPAGTHRSSVLTYLHRISDSGLPPVASSEAVGRSGPGSVEPDLQQALARGRQRLDPTGATAIGFVAAGFLTAASQQRQPLLRIAVQDGELST
jgi:hypothetical protein